MMPPIAETVTTAAPERQANIMQARMAAGERMSEEDYQRLQQIGAILQFNHDVSAFLMAEFRFAEFVC